MKSPFCSLGLHKYQEISDKSYFPYYQCKKCGKKVDAMLGKQTSLKDVLEWAGIIIFVLFVIFGLIYLKETEEIVSESIPVEFLKIEEEKDSTYATYVSHEEKIYLKMEITEYESEFERDALENIKTVKKTHDGKIFSKSPDYSLIFNGENKNLNAYN